MSERGHEKSYSLEFCVEWKIHKEGGYLGISKFLENYS